MWSHAGPCLPFGSCLVGPCCHPFRLLQSFLTLFCRVPDFWVEGPNEYLQFKFSLHNVWLWILDLFQSTPRRSFSDHDCIKDWNINNYSRILLEIMFFFVSSFLSFLSFVHYFYQSWLFLPNELSKSLVSGQPGSVGHGFPSVMGLKLSQALVVQSHRCHHFLSTSCRQGRL